MNPWSIPPEGTDQRSPDADERHPPGPREPLSLARARSRRWSFYYLVPLAALGLVAYLGYSFLSRRGPEITIRFATGEGLSEGQTWVKHRAVQLGLVENVELSDDLEHVVAHVRMNAEAEDLLTERTRFWVVRPRLGAGLAAFQSGLETLVSGAYVAIDPGSGEGEPRRHFVGLEEPPAVRSGEPGKTFNLKGGELGGLSAGAPVFYSDVEVGELVSLDLADPRGSRDARARVFVREPYASHVVEGTRFWRLSPLRLESGPEGLSLRIASLQAAFTGGLAFRPPPDSDGESPSPAETSFPLYSSQSRAEIGFLPQSAAFVSYFDASLQGLEIGSPVWAFGRRVGTVTDVDLASDPRPGREGTLAARVAYAVEVGRAPSEATLAALSHDAVTNLNGFRLYASLEASNPLTGTRVVALKYAEAEGAAPPTLEGDSLVLPGEAHGLGEAIDSLAAVAARLGSIPFEDIGKNVDSAVESIERAVAGPELEQVVSALSAALVDVRELSREARQGLGPALRQLPAMSQRLDQALTRAEAAFGRGGYGSGSTVQRNLEQMTDQVGDAARSVRVLADFLHRHPEALVRGRRDSP